MDKFPGTGMIMTPSLNRFVTDSSPGMTAYVTGNHAKNGQEGVYPANVTNPFYQPRVEYLAEYLHRVMGKSLVLVLADHECSGLTLTGALSGGIDNLKKLPPDNATTDSNTQPQRQKAVSIQDAAGFPRYQIAADGYPVTLDVDNKIVVGFGASGDRYEGWMTKPRPVIDTLLPNDIKSELTTKNYPPMPSNPQATDTDPYGDSHGYFIRGQAIGREQAVHTASDIPISAYSSGSNAFQLFYGVQESTDVFFKLMRAVLGQ